MNSLFSFKTLSKLNRILLSADMTFYPSLKCIYNIAV